MRNALFVSTLFAVSLAGGAAFADKPPKALERARSHGEQVDKTYRTADKAGMQASQAQTPAASYAHQAKSPIDKAAAARINCSDSGADCAASHGDSKESGGQAVMGGAQERSVRMPAFMEKITGSDRTNFNEAGEDQGMSKRAANRAWAQARGATAAAPKDHDEARDNHASVPAAAAEKKMKSVEKESSETRMSCNEADECMMSSKAAKKIWSYESVKAGTFTGPPAAAPSPAAVKIAEMKGQKGVAGAKVDQAAAKAEGAKQDHDHAH
jgi:hypothetical protein